MKSEKFQPFIEEIKSKSNLIVLLIGIVFLTDFFLGSPITSKLILLQFHIMKKDPSAANFKIITIFGDFTDIPTLARLFDKSLSIIFMALAGFAYCRGLVRSLLKRELT